MHRAQCVLPVNRMFKTGLVNTKFSRDGGQSYPYVGTFYLRKFCCVWVHTYGFCQHLRSLPIVKSSRLLAAIGGIISTQFNLVITWSTYTPGMSRKLISNSGSRKLHGKNHRKSEFRDVPDIHARRICLNDFSATVVGHVAD